MAQGLFPKRCGSVFPSLISSSQVRPTGPKPMIGRGVHVHGNPGFSSHHIYLPHLYSSGNPDLRTVDLPPVRRKGPGSGGLSLSTCSGQGSALSTGVCHVSDKLMGSTISWALDGWISAERLLAFWCVCISQGRRLERAASCYC
jgi:hypothetical protein